MSSRVKTDGKLFSDANGRFTLRGVSYGTFAPRASDGERFPERDQIKFDLHAMADAGFNVVRTYTPPPEDLIETAADAGLRVLAGVFYPDWRYLVGLSARDRRRVIRDGKAEVRSAADRLGNRPEIMALSVGNEVPADVVRWIGEREVAGTIADLVDISHEVDPDLLVTYASFPTTEYLSLDNIDFVMFNVFLERQVDLRRYLTRLHHLAGDRPVVLGEMGLDSLGTAQGATRQAEVLDWQMHTALERGMAGTCMFTWTDEWFVGDAPVEGWHFGLTTVDREPKPSLEVVSRWNNRTIADLPDTTWPSISVVVCAHNEQRTLPECLEHTCALDYPHLEIIVVDDGSRDATADIARGFERVRLVSLPHGGLSVARNEGYRMATGDIVAYLDADAYPTPEWPYYLALGLDADHLGGVGGPNYPPESDGIGANQVAQAPGGPVHVLLSDDRAEHIPGCNMAFRRDVLVETGGFDPVYRAAGDDVDFCWRVLDRGWDIGFHPAAVVWHHRRVGIRTYLRQQRGYGRAEALVEARHPDRFTASGSARWRGRIYHTLGSMSGTRRVYRGLYGSALFQSVYRGGGHAIDLAHQVGIPAATFTIATAPLALLNVWMITPAAVALAFVLALFAVDVGRARPPRDAGWRFRFGVATLHLLQPLVRWWGRQRHRSPARRDLPPRRPLDGPVQRRGPVLLIPERTARSDVAATIVDTMRREGFRIRPATGWEDHDARVLASWLVAGDLVTSSHPPGCIQARIRRRWRHDSAIIAACLLAGAALLASVVNVAVMVVPIVALAADVARGWWNTGPRWRRTLVAAASD